MGSVLSTTGKLNGTASFGSNETSSFSKITESKPKSNSIASSSTCSTNGVTVDSAKFFSSQSKKSLNISSSRNYHSILDSTNDFNNNHLDLKLSDESNNHSNKLKTIRMLSSPSCSLEVEEDDGFEPQQDANLVLSRNFLIDNMTDYYNNFIKKEINFESFNKNDYDGYDDDDDEDECNKEATKQLAACNQNESFSDVSKKESRFDKIFKGRLKRSKSLEIGSSRSNLPIVKSIEMPANIKGKLFI